jgi:hypothetical protein
MFVMPDISYKTINVFNTVDQDSLKLLEFANLALIDVPLAHSLDNAKFAIEDTSCIKINAFPHALMELLDPIKDALFVLIDVSDAMPINVLFAIKELTFTTVNAYLSVQEELS